MGTLRIDDPDGHCLHDAEAPETGGTLADQLAHLGYPLNTRCGQRGLCRGCEVAMTSGTLEWQGQTTGAPATIKACQSRLTSPDPVEIRLLEHSRPGLAPQITSDYRLASAGDREPVFPVDPERPYGVATDIGTTTVVLILVDLRSGTVAATASAYNRQIEFADNVLTRIEQASGHPRQRARLQHAINARTLTPLLAEATRRAGVSPSRIGGLVLAGNTTMLHLLVGSDPSGLGVSPFTPAFLAGRTILASELGLEALPEDCPVRLLPGLSAFVGADITAGLFATGMSEDARTALLVDVGTNGEIVLRHGGRLLACATAAGPAFEGSGLTSGRRAERGAIAQIHWQAESGRFAGECIGGVPWEDAHGLCGSAYLDFLAEGARHGLLTERGRFSPRFWDALPESMRQATEGIRAVHLLPRPERATGVSEADVAIVLQAKAAIAAGILTLLELAELAPQDVEILHLAGSFGNHVDLDSAITCGLLPGFRRDQIRTVGNSALAGALRALQDREVWPRMEALRERVEIIELNRVETFEDHFIDQMELPSVAPPE